MSNVDDLIAECMADLVAVVRGTDPNMRNAMRLAGSLISKATVKAREAGEDPEMAAADEWRWLYKGRPELTADVSAYCIPIAVGILVAIEAQERDVKDEP
ncbi:MAG: hypothetical protein ACYS7M_10725 [Planctomycetota bacterium]|jgi:hypothetical protein